MFTKEKIKRLLKVNVKKRNVEGDFYDVNETIEFIREISLLNSIGKVYFVLNK